MMAKLSFLICVYFSVSVCADSSWQEANDASPKILRKFRNFETCVDNFDIHKDKIIRTEDSRAMGAKYISEADMNSREECLRMCCVTDTCDVFVFEEKRPGSCYLFNCGSSANFKCKFTKHHNYTSGVSTIGQQRSNTQEVDTPSKHEEELNRLRKPESTSTVGLNVTFGATSPPQVPPQDSRDTFPKVNKTAGQSSTEVHQCSRFQFRCRTSGECIAIYNACDGIPQCSDASDESLELGCPLPVTSSLLPILATSANKSEEENSFIKSYENAYHLGQQKMASLPEKLENMEPDDLPSEQMMVAEHGDSLEQPHNSQRIPVPVSSNILKQPEISHNMSPSDYQMRHREKTHFKKPEESLQRNPAPDYSGFRQYLNPTMEQDADKLEDEAHNYLSVKLMNDRAKNVDHSNFRQKPPINFQSHSKPSFFQQQSDIADIQRHNEQLPLFGNVDHASKLHPPTPLDLKHQQSELANALHHQLTNIHLTELQPDEYRNQHVETKETKQQQIRNQVHDSLQHPQQLDIHEIDIEKSRSRNELHIESESNHQARNGAKEQIQSPSFQESPLQEVPGRSYKYEDEDRHIFTHKGYGLVAESDSSEIPYRMAVPSVPYKLSNMQNNGYMDNIPSFGSQMERNSWAEQIHPTSHVLKELKNTPQPPEVEGGYQLPSDYMYEDGQRPVLNTGSFTQHAPGRRLPSAGGMSTQKEGPLDRSNFLQVPQRVREHPQQGGELPPPRKAVAIADAKPNAPAEGALKAKHEEGAASEKHGYANTHAATPYTSGTPDGVKRSHVANHHLERFVSLQQADVSEPPNDHQEDRPSGALLSTSFGLCITFIMVVLVVCRLRVIRRRLRRNGKSLYAHDADYLVNGMYL